MADHEAVVGDRLLDELDLTIGDDLVLEGASTPLRIVGRGLFPPLDDGNSIASGIGLTRAGLTATRADVGDDFMSSGYAQALVDIADDVDEEELMRRYSEEFGFVRPGPRPTSVANLGEVTNVPVLLAVFLALLGALALAHSTAVAASRRRLDLAILRCLGFQRRQLVRTAVLHTFTVVIAGALVGLPLGVIAGRSTWRAVASGVGVATDAAGVARALLTVAAGAAALGLALAIPWAVSAAANPRGARRCAPSEPHQRHPDGMRRSFSR